MYAPLDPEAHLNWRPWLSPDRLHLIYHEEGSRPQRFTSDESFTLRTTLILNGDNQRHSRCITPGLSDYHRVDLSQPYGDSATFRIASIDPTVYSPLDPSPSLSTPGTITQYCSAPESIARLWGIGTIPSSLRINTLCSLISDPATTIFSAGDGSVTEHGGSHGYSAYLKHPERIPRTSRRRTTTLLTGAGPCDGEDEQVESFRTELTSILAPASFLTHFAIEHGIPCLAQLHITVDNDSALSSSEEWYNTSNPKFLNYDARDFDVLYEIRHYLQQWNQTPVFTQVQGHAEKRKKPAQYTTDEHHNCLCDEFASSIWELPLSHPIRPTNTAPRFPSLSMRIHAHSNPTTGLVVKNLPIIIHGMPFEDHLHEIWPNVPLQDIHWNPIGTIVKSLSLSQQTRWMKAAYNQWCTTVVQGRRCGSSHYTCPLCQLDDETHDHVLRCPHPRMYQHRQKRWDKFHALLVELNTPTSLIEEIQRSLKSWLQDLYSGYEEFSPMERCTFLDVSHPATIAQEHIGWNHFLRGRITREFAASLPLPNKARQAWPGRVISELMDWTQSMWRQRCAILHECNGKSLPAHVERQVRKAYELFEYDHPVDKKYFALPIMKRLRRSLEDNLLWIEQVQRSGRKKEHDLKNSNTLHAYFTTNNEPFAAAVHSALDGLPQDAPRDPPPPPHPPDPDPDSVTESIYVQQPLTNYFDDQLAP